MLAARGVSLGLGKINLSEFTHLRSHKFRATQIKLEEQVKKPKLTIRKKADAKTLWAACRAVIFGCVVIVIGLAMTVLGYFDKQFSERMEVVEGSVVIYHDRIVQYQLKSMQYLGPILMGIGSFILIIACVVTLESRDKHTQLITEESSKKMVLTSIEERSELAIDGDSANQESEGSFNIEDKGIADKHSISTWVEVHRARNGESSQPSSLITAPLAEIDSLDLHSCSSQILTERESDINPREF